MTVCPKCKFYNICKGRLNETVENCVRFKSAEKTNEEWFDGLSTKEKAKVLRRKTHGNDEENERIEQGWINWLKAKHEDNPPDIPSVPSWDKWLEGERTKCEYCDGNSTECELVGRSECPKTPKTEQEYIQTCDTEQLAEAIFRICERATWDYNVKIMVAEKKKDLIVEWLKQPHTNFVRSRKW